MGDKPLPRVPAILGPTAAGKTSVAIEIAERINGEIVSCDSRQVLKYLDIGTAKPTASERKRAQFHLIDVIRPDRFLNAFEYRKLAETALDGILSRGRVPLMTVGTGFYFSAMTDGIFEAPGADEDFRRRMEMLARSQGSATLHARLSEVDPQTAALVPENDLARIIRALELYHLTGKTKGELSAETQLPPSPYHFVVVQLVLDRKELYSRIDRRCRKMLDDGFINEARSLRETGLLSDELASKIVGYNEVYQYLDGLCNMEEMLSRFQQATRNYAKRQMTWFRNHASGRNCDASANMLADNVLRCFDAG